MTSNEPLGQVLTFDTLSAGAFNLVFDGKKNQNPARNNFLRKLLIHHAIKVILKK